MTGGYFRPGGHSVGHVERAACDGPRLDIVSESSPQAPPHARELRSRLAASVGPIAVIATVNPGALPADHWTREPAIGSGRLIGEASHFFDLARYLIAAPITDVRVVAARAGGRPQDDIAHVAIAFSNGSTAAIHYLANGSAAFPKERIEAFADGHIWRIDNWRRLIGFGARGKGSRFSSTAKGHLEEIAALAAAVRTGGPPPIPYDELFDVSRWVIRAARMVSDERFDAVPHT